ncbi:MULTISPECIES: hypothetical protein [Lactobacillaceae]|uniref:hypothetical protein n=1 Tax=Lactobacillaceae TaxID=33958 RepID=UPI00145674F6|nr:hypothetical protein [Lactobacillus sp. HBUAS51381]NLR08984.1 hypothetical protein [Lactobacillus sp. HBUAS51381]
MQRDSINQLIVDLIAAHYTKNDAAFDSIVLEFLRGLNAESNINSQISAVKILRLLDQQGPAATSSTPAKNLSIHAAIDPQMFKLEPVHGNLANIDLSPDRRKRITSLFPHDAVNTRGRFLITGTGKTPSILAKLIAGGSPRQVLTMDVKSSLSEFTKSGGGGI